MAASKPLIDDLVNELDCVVCLEQKKLHLLPCVHRCCQECIGNLAGDDGQFPCPICRRDVIVPDAGFPVCLLSEFLRDKIKLASTQGSASKCWSCKVKSVEARCKECFRFICYRCDKRDRCEKTSDGKHDSDDLEEISAVASSQLDGWKAKTKRKISALEEVVRQKQREIEDEKNVLQACENVDKQSDSAEKITLIEQICREYIFPDAGKVQIVSSTIGELPEKPKGLRFISLHPTDSQCSTVSHVGDEKLALGCSIGLKLFNKTTAEMELVAKLKRLKVTEYNGEIFLLYKKEVRIIVARYDSSGIEEMFSFLMKSNTASYLAVNQHYIVAMDIDNENIKLYNRPSRVVLTKALPGVSMVYNVKFSPDGSLIVTGSGNSVTKYRIPENPEEQLVRVWTVKPETQVIGVAVTDKGTMFVAGSDSKKIYIISDKGERLTTLNHDQLPAPYEDISIRGDELAVAGWDDHNFLIFKIV